MFSGFSVTCAFILQETCIEIIIIELLENLKNDNVFLIMDQIKVSRIPL